MERTRSTSGKVRTGDGDVEWLYERRIFFDGTCGMVAGLLDYQEVLVQVMMIQDGE